MTLLSRLVHRTVHAIPFECALCQRWPSRAFEGVSGLCQSCIQTHSHAPRFPPPSGLDDCVAAVHFEAPWSALIARYKFAPEPGLARLFAGLMLRDEHVRAMLNQVDGVIPLPLAPERLAQRGFNQALQLAKYLCRASKIDPRSLYGNSLVRTRDTAPQRPLGREARQHNVAGAFALQTTRGKGYSDSVNSPSLAGQHLLLVDDVMTTGATLSAAALPLRRAGAASVSAVVIARTPLR
jgi:ComF family protein